MFIAQIQPSAWHGMEVRENRATVTKPSNEQSQTRAVTHIALLLESVGQVAVGIREVWL